MKYLYYPDQTAQQRQLEKKRWIYPVRLAMEATYRRNSGHQVEWVSPGCFLDLKVEYAFGKYDRLVTKPEGIDFLDLPAADPVLTKAKDPRYQENGNFKYHPATYIQATSGCWYGKCLFCVEKNQQFKCRPVKDVIRELSDLYFMQGFREVFDDSGTFPDGEWLREFCEAKITSGLAGLHFSCNMRIGADVDFDLMKQSGFRMLLYGIESASPKTLKKINKGIKYEEIIPTIKQAAKAGLSPHITIMLGSPGESDKDADNSIGLVHRLLKSGYAKTAQASLYTVNNRKPNEKMRKRLKEIYKVAYSPRFWFNKLRDLRDWDDVRYLIKQIKSGINKGE